MHGIVEAFVCHRGLLDAGVHKKLVKKRHALLACILVFDWAHSFTATLLLFICLTGEFSSVKFDLFVF